MCDTIIIIKIVAQGYNDGFTVVYKDIFLFSTIITSMTKYPFQHSLLMCTGFQEGTFVDFNGRSFL